MAVFALITSSDSTALDPDWGTWSQEEQCDFCRDHGMGMICNFAEMRGLTGLFMESLDNMANAHEVDAYIECQLMGRFEPNKADFLRAYQDEYRGYISQAAQTFGVPPQLMQCSFLIEGHYDRNTPDSSAAARGLCQFNQITANHVKERLANGSSVSGITDDTSRTDRKDYGHWQRWDEYFTNLRSLGMYNNPTPADFTYETGSRIPQNCIGAAGLYYNDMMYQLSSKLGVGDLGEVLEFVDDGDRRDATLNLMLVMGAAYNMGPGGASRILGRLDNPTSLTAMVAQLESDAPGQTKDYMDSLRRCMTSGNFEPPTAWFRSNPAAAPSCTDQSQRLQAGEFGEHNYLGYWP